LIFVTVAEDVLTYVTHFPKLFDMIDESENEDVESLKSEQFEPVVDACTLCDMCFMTKCPYVPPHDFDLDFPPFDAEIQNCSKKNWKITKCTKTISSNR